MKTLIWDIETSDLEVLIRTYDLKNRIKYFSPDTIQRDWTMLGAAWMDIEEDTPTAISVNPQDPLNDYELVKHMHSVLDSADALIGHNSDAFDLKKFNTRAIYYDLPPLSQKIQIDTLKIARKYFKLTSNKLSYLCKFLKVSMKDESPDWEKVIAGDADELRYMREYNKGDVIATKECYLKLRSWHHTHPNMNFPIVRAANGDSVEVCRVCQSPNLIVSKHRKKAGKIEKTQKQCKDCGSYTTFGRA